jgi:dTDP-4-dehydrorhamnose 3,5-epimerase
MRRPPRANAVLSARSDPGTICDRGIPQLNPTTMPFAIRNTELPDILEIESPVHGDPRGFFTEIYNAGRWTEAGFPERRFVQDNLSCSARGTLRGLHYQIDPHGQDKLVRCLRGKVYDVAVDIRRGSPHFGRWVGRTLTGDNGAALWVPSGFAHGFLVLEDDSLVLYKCTACYAPQAERSILWNDPAIGIVWPEQATSLSAKDAAAPTLAGADFNFVYQNARR